MPYKSLEITNASLKVEPSAKKIQFYKGYSSLTPTNSSVKIFDLELVKQDIINTFSTRRGERVMNPSFGSIIWDVLMEPMTPAIRDSLNEDIKRICNSDPRVEPLELKLTEYPSGYIIEATLKLKGTDQSTYMKLIFDQNIGLNIQ